MSTNTLTVVEIAYDPNGDPVAHIDAWQALETPLMQSAQADSDGRRVALFSISPGDIDYDVSESVRAEIKARIDSGSSTPVLKSHLDALGITDAVEAWASE